MILLSAGHDADGRVGRTSRHGVIERALEQAQIIPEDMPKPTYEFAVERDATGYTPRGEWLLPLRGVPNVPPPSRFIEDGRAIWHYNNTPEQYGGRFDRSWTYSGPLGSLTVDHTWAWARPIPITL